MAENAPEVKLKVTVADFNCELTLDEARALQARLNEVLGQNPIPRGAKCTPNAGWTYHPR